jgi:hypothetical protein
MGKKMEKNTILFGEKQSAPLNGFNAWPKLKAAIEERVGTGSAIDWHKGKEAVDQASKDPNMRDAYVKVGVIDKNLILRVKQKKFTGDQEYDGILIKAFTDKVTAYQRQQQTLAKGREILVDQLAAARSRKEAQDLLRDLGATPQDFADLGTSEDVYRIMRRLKVPDKVTAALLPKGLLFTDWGLGVRQVKTAKTAHEVSEGMKLAGLSNREISDVFENGVSDKTILATLDKLLLPEALARDLASRIIDMEPPPRVVAARLLPRVTSRDQALVALKHLGFGPKVKDWENGGSAEGVAAALTAELALDNATANRIANLILS